MIRFFRTLRQNLLAQGRFTRYLAYAIGEIVLVVIGILIALQINNWNNEQTYRAREIKYLNGLKADFAVDLVNLNEFISDKERKTSSAWLLLNSPPPVTANELQYLDSLSWNVFSWNTFEPGTKTLDELIGSGNLSFITNDSIKFLVLDVVQEYQNLAVHTAHMRREYDMYLYDRSISLKDQFIFVDFNKTVQTDRLSMKMDVSEAQLDSLRLQWTELLKDKTFRNGLKLALLNNRGMSKSCAKTVSEIKKSINLIDQEIDKTK